MRDKIINKAGEMFLSLGFKSITMDDIAKELGISKKTLYKYFSNKAALVDASTEAVLNTINDTINKIKEHGYNAIEEDITLAVIVVSYAGKLLGIVVDKLLQQKEIIEKSLAKPLEKTKLLSGTTILGNGNVCLVIDITIISDLLFKTLAQKKVESEV